MKLILSKMRKAIQEFDMIIFEARREKNPCSLCANMRRGALNNYRLSGCITNTAQVNLWEK